MNEFVTLQSCASPAAEQLQASLGAAFLEHGKVALPSLPLFTPN
jgi:hypothetical protein